MKKEIKVKRIIAKLEAILNSNMKYVEISDRWIKENGNLKILCNERGYILYSSTLLQIFHLLNYNHLHMYITSSAMEKDYGFKLIIWGF